MLQMLPLLALLKDANLYFTTCLFINNVRGEVKLVFLTRFDSIQMCHGGNRMPCGGFECISCNLSLLSQLNDEFA